MAGEVQEFNLRWNNFQENITLQFEALRVDQDFTDASIVCEGGVRLQAHRVVLSACSPLFKEMFKNNPCSHPIIFMRDVDAYSVRSMLKFMYTGEVDIAEACLMNFVRFAESLQIRGLTEPGIPINSNATRAKKKGKGTSGDKSQNSHLTLDQDSHSQLMECMEETGEHEDDLSYIEGNPKLRKQFERKKAESTRTEELILNDNNETHNNTQEDHIKSDIIQIKIEPTQIVEHLGSSEEEPDDIDDYKTMAMDADVPVMPKLLPSVDSYRTRLGRIIKRKKPVQTSWPMHIRKNCTKPNHKEQPSSVEPTNFNQMIELAEGIEVDSEQLREVEHKDFGGLTRGLANMLFQPEELANCTISGKGRSNNGLMTERPPLDQRRVQAIVSYVLSKFPMLKSSQIKQVLATNLKDIRRYNKFGG